MRALRNLAVLLATVALVASACGGDDGTSASDDVEAALSDAAESGDPDQVADAVTDAVEESVDDLASDEPTDGGDEAESGSGDVDCVAIDPALEIVGINWVYLQNVAGSGDVSLFADIAPDGFIAVDFDGLTTSIEDLRPLEAHGDNVAPLLDRLQETADLAQGAIDADDAGQAEAMAAITELTDSGQQMVRDQLDLGLALSDAGC